MSGPFPKSLYEIRMEGWKALTDRLGAAGAMRFMMQYDPGHGDYSRERRALFAELDLEELLKAIESSRRSDDRGDRRQS
jgi:hypothetical protein